MNNYELLDRLQQDCKYFLGNGNHCLKYLFRHDINEYIAYMKKIYKSFSFFRKPIWISIRKINKFEKLMNENCQRR